MIPLSVYRVKDLVRQIVGNKNFHDSIITSLALASIAIAFPFLPALLLVPFIIVAFILTLLNPLLGLMALLFFALPMLIYQAPLLALIFIVFISISLFAGYKHYRTITYSYALVFLSLSYLGNAFVIPGFLIAILVLGFKRGAVLAAIVILISVMISGLTGIALSGPIIYNQTSAHTAINSTNIAGYLTPDKSVAPLGNMLGSWSSAFSRFIESFRYLYVVFAFAAVSIAKNIIYTLLQLVLWLFAIFAVSNYAVKSRSPYKGALASLFGFVIPISYIVFSRLESVPVTPIRLITVLSFIATPVFIFALEAKDINVVMALDVMKQDILGKFGVAFEDLTRGSSETLDDIANYDETKKELKQAVLAPIERRELAGAYGVSPAKGLLLFGPPGTGKTLLMRALANEIRAGFFYVKASSLISPYPGESAQALAKIFATAKKQAPCVLFFDEIDAIAGRRETQLSESGRELITTMLSEMDGFQKISNIVIVGATNAPQFLDPSIMRPGRFDKILYMPLPDQPGRAKIFKYYLSRLPIDKEMDYDKLASLTVRYSGADIKNVCDEVGRQVGDMALSKKEMLIIRMVDVLKVIKMTKPSTSLAQIEEYNTFKLDYERRAHHEVQTEDEEKIVADDVIGLDEAKKALHDAVEVPILHPDLVKKYDVGSIRGILLFGPPGTGKTMLMGAVANELGGIHVLTLCGFDISKYGSDKSIAAIKEIFDRAKEQSPAIVFIDEIDALVPSRDSASESGMQITSEFLQEFDKLKDMGVIVVAATNRPDVLDPALLRPGRFDKLVFVAPPDKDERVKIFQKNLAKVPLSESIDLDAIAEMTGGFTGADIVSICRQAKINALEASLAKGADAKVEMQDIQKLLKRARPSAPSSAMGRYLTFFMRYGKR